MKEKRSVRPQAPSRRSFLAGVGISAIAATAADLALPRASTAALPETIPDVIRVPDRVSAFLEGTAAETVLVRSGSCCQANGIAVAFELRKNDNGSESALFLTAPDRALSRIRLRWRGGFALDWQFLGDAWERAYGDLEFRGVAGDRLMPWYFLATRAACTENGSSLTHAYGVKTGASAICSWQADPKGLTLWLDVGNGGSGVRLGDRRLHAATVVMRAGARGESPARAARLFCKSLCEQPRLPAAPLYGSNNWYYAYGQNTSAERSLRDAQLLGELVPAEISSRPFCVIDMGWHAARDGAGPAARTSKAYPDMPALAGKMRGMGVRPGIWTRPTLTADPKAATWRLPPAGGRPQGDLIVMDPTIPEALHCIGENVRLLRNWGYELIKHDFSTFDLTGRWGFEMGPGITEPGWHFHDRSLTSAEVIRNLYQAIRQAAGDSVLIGCNTIGHLAAGLVEAQRIGDDTSGREWSRTRKMGVNALAFRLPQHQTFFAADADCVPLTSEIPWELTRQWLDLVARSGTALFVSVDPDALLPAQRPFLQSALRSASRPRTPGVPLDWLQTTTPGSWTLDGRTARYDWYRDDDVPRALP